MLVGPPCEDPCLVTEIEPPAQQAAPVRVPVIVVVDDARETQHHVAKKRRVLHHVWICCRDGERRQRTEKRKEDITGSKGGEEEEGVMQEGQAGEEGGPSGWRKGPQSSGERRENEPDLLWSCRPWGTGHRAACWLQPGFASSPPAPARQEKRDLTPLRVWIRRKACYSTLVHADLQAGRRRENLTAAEPRHQHISFQP